MRLALVQQDIIWGDHEANRRHLDSILEGIEGADIIILPEMFSTGFATSSPEFAEALPSPSMEWMKKKAAAKGCAICGSLAVKDGDRCRNRFFFVKPDSEVSAYDKKHLFIYGGEDKTFSAGGKRVIVEWRGVRMLLAVCYDLRFPVWLRNRGDYDGILLCANWPEARRTAWDILVRARAVENQCFVAAVNRCGDDPVCHYSGGTAFINPYGETTALAEDNRESVVYADFDLKALKDYCTKFPVLQDEDRFELI